MEVNSMVRQCIGNTKAQLLGTFGAILLLIGGAVWVEAASQETYEPEIPL